MKIHILCAHFVCLFAMGIAFDLVTKAILLFCIATVFFVEIFNTAIEAIVDLYIQKFHRLAMLAKDAAAASVLVMAFICTLIFIDILFINANFIFSQLNNLKLFFYSGILLLLLEYCALFIKLNKNFFLVRSFCSLLIISLMLVKSVNPIFAVLSFTLIILSIYAKLYSLDDEI